MNKTYTIYSLLITAIISLSLLYPVNVSAQTHGEFIMADIGTSYPDGFEGTLAYEHETDYHNAWEFFGTYYLMYAKDQKAGHITNQSFWHNYNTWAIGVAYKPCITHSRNSHGSLRLGVSCGSDKKTTVGYAHIGYESTFNLYKSWNIFFQIKEDIGLKTKETFHTGITTGLKFSL